MSTDQQGLLSPPALFAAMHAYRLPDTPGLLLATPNTDEMATISIRMADHTKKQRAQPCKAQTHIQNNGEETQENTKQQALPESWIPDTCGVRLHTLLLPILEGSFLSSLVYSSLKDRRAHQRFLVYE